MTNNDSPRATWRDWAALSVLALSTLLTSIDLFVMLLALPRITAALHASATQQLWIVDMYGFILSGFLITMGTLGDRIGRRKLMLMGGAAFGAASLLAAFSTTPAMLIGARALLGVAGATLAPTALSLISHIFKNAKQRASAIGVWLACLVGGAIIGPVVGGLLLGHFWWGSVFLIGIPAMLLLLVLGPILLPEYRNPAAGRLHFPSVLLSLASILPAVYGIKEIARGGWQALPIIAIVAGLIAGVIFIRQQLAMADPLLDMRLFKNRVFSTLLFAMLCNTMLPGGVMVIIMQHLQLVEGLSPLHAGLWILPAIAASIVGFQLSPILARYVRPERLIPGALLLSVLGLIVLTQVSVAHGLATLLIGFALFNLGAAPLTTLGTNIVLGHVPPEKAGQAAGISQTGNEFGFALGVAAVGSVVAVVYRHGMGVVQSLNLSKSTTVAAQSTASGAIDAASRLAGSSHDALVTAARTSFTTGLHVAAGIGAGIMLGVVVLLWRVLGSSTQVKNR